MVGTGDVHDAVNDDGGDFVAFGGELIGPLYSQAGNIGCVDFLELRKSVGVIVAGIGEPVARLLFSVQNAVDRNLTSSGCADENEKNGGPQNHWGPRREARNAMRSSNSTGLRTAAKEGIGVSLRSLRSAR